MDKAVEKAVTFLPPRLARAFDGLSDEQSRMVREIRLRADTYLSLSTDVGERFLQKSGQLSAVKTPEAIAVGQPDVSECVKRLCGFAMHLHEGELRQGFITASGCRAGLAGTVIQSGEQEVLSPEGIVSVCLRVAREHVGCADALLKAIVAQSFGSVLVCGVPSSGKTSLLRDVAKGLSQGRFGERRRVAVVDERSELSLGDALCDCDVLRGCRKAQGIERAVRSLSPEFLIFDEWTSEEEAQAVAFAVSCGVRVITSVHAPSLSAVSLRRKTADVCTAAAFPLAAVMAPNHTYALIREDAG